MIRCMGHALLSKTPSKGKTTKASKATKAKPVKAAKAMSGRTATKKPQVHAPNLPAANMVRKFTRAEKSALADHAVEERVAEVVAKVLQRKPAVNADLVAMLLGQPDDVLPL